MFNLRKIVKLFWRDLLKENYIIPEKVNNFLKINKVKSYNTKFSR